MSDPSFTAGFTGIGAPRAAINDVRSWWSGEIEGGTDRDGGTSDDH